MIPFELNLLPKYCLEIWHRLSFFLNFLVTGLCNSSANCPFTFTPVLLFAIARGRVLLSKTYRPYLLMLFDIHNIYHF